MPTLSQRSHAHRTKPLNQTELTQWFSKFESSDESLRHFGLKHTNQVLSHLKSPAGKALQSLIIEDITDKQRQNNLSKLIQLKQRMRRYVLLRFLLEQLKLKAANQKLNGEIQKQIDILLAHERKELESSLEQIRDDAHESKVAAFEALEQSLEQTLLEMEDDVLSMEARLELLDEYDTLMEQQYQLYATIFDDYDFDTPNLEEYLRTQFDAFEHEIDSSYAKILPALTHHDQHSDPNSTIQTPHALHLNMRQEMLRSIQTAHQQHHQLYNREGQIVHSFNQADFYVPFEKKLVFDNGQFYLLNQNVKFQQLLPKQKQDAHTAFTTAKNDIMSIQMRLSDQRNQHQVTQQNRKDELVSKLHAMKNEISVVRNLLNQTQQARLALQQTAPAPRPMPTNAPKQSATNSKQAPSHPQQRAPSPNDVHNQQQMKNILKPPVDTQNSNDPLTPFKTTPRPKPY